MPRPWFVQQPEPNDCHKAYVRLVRGLRSFVGGQDRLSWLEGWRTQLFASVLDDVGHLVTPTLTTAEARC